MKYPKLKPDYKTPLDEQFKKLGIENYLNWSKIENLFTPSQDGYIYDVEDGEETKGKSPEECEEIFKTQNRRGLTIHEVLAIIRKNPKVLKNHYIDCTGSRYVSAVRVPDVCLDRGDRPLLGWGGVDYSIGRWGSASCGSRTLENLESLPSELVINGIKYKKL